MANTSIKVPVELRDRLSELARRPTASTEAEDLSPTLSDGLDPEENWSDIL